MRGMGRYSCWVPNRRSQRYDCHRRCDKYRSCRDSRYYWFLIMDRLTSMAVFVKAADSGSFAATASALGLSSQMVGKHVRALEERVGARLLNRTTRRQSLTEFGAAFYERCTPVVPADLARHECLGFAYWARPPVDEWQFTGADGAHSVRVGSRLAINNGQALRAAALEGFGIILLSQELLEDDLAAGRLVRILPGYEPPSRPMHILFAPDRKPTPKLRSFIDFVVATFG